MRRRSYLPAPGNNHCAKAPHPDQRGLATPSFPRFGARRQNNAASINTVGAKTEMAHDNLRK